MAPGGADCCVSSLECVGIYASFRYFHRWAFPRNRDQGVFHHLSVLSILEHVTTNNGNKHSHTYTFARNECMQKRCIHTYTNKSCIQKIKLFVQRYYAARSLLAFTFSCALLSLCENNLLLIVHLPLPCLMCVVAIVLV